MQVVLLSADGAISPNPLDRKRRLSCCHERLSTVSRVSSRCSMAQRDTSRFSAAGPAGDDSSRGATSSDPHATTPISDVRMPANLVPPHMRKLRSDGGFSAGISSPMKRGLEARRERLSNVAGATAAYLERNSIRCYNESDDTAADEVTEFEMSKRASSASSLKSFSRPSSFSRRTSSCRTTSETNDEDEEEDNVPAQLSPPPPSINNSFEPRPLSPQSPASPDSPRRAPPPAPGSAYAARLATLTPIGSAPALSVTTEGLVRPPPLAVDSAGSCGYRQLSRDSAGGGGGGGGGSGLGHIGGVECGGGGGGGFDERRSEHSTRSDDSMLEGTTPLRGSSAACLSRGNGGSYDESCGLTNAGRGETPARGSGGSGGSGGSCGSAGGATSWWPCSSGSATWDSGMC